MLSSEAYKVYLSRDIWEYCMQNESDLEKCIYELGSELSKIHILMSALDELAIQDKENDIVHINYREFFELISYSFWDALIHGISRCHDQNENNDRQRHG